MTDIIDHASALSEFYLDAALRQQQSVAKVAPRGVGRCLNCGEDTEGDRRWCDAGCRDEWEHA